MDPRPLWRGLLVASALEAFLLLMLIGYAPLFVHDRLGGSYFVASQAAAWPMLATFIGSNGWGQVARRVGLAPLVSIGLVGYFGIGLALLLAHSAWLLVSLLGGLTLLSSALAPAVISYMTRTGGRIGERLALRLSWQSSGWMTGGLLGGYIYTLSPNSFPLLIAALGVLALGLAVVSWMQLPRARPEPILAQHAMHGRHWGYVVAAIVLPYFLMYAGNEGFFANFGLYLHAMRFSTQWLGWSAAISTGLGWILARRAGRFADRIGGRAMLVRIMGVYAGTYAVMALSPWPWVTLAVFSLPLYPFLSVAVQRAAAEVTHGSQHAAVMGMVNGASGLATAVGSSLIGTVETRFTPRASPWASGGMVMVALAMFGIAKITHPGTDADFSDPT